MAWLTCSTLGVEYRTTTLIAIYSNVTSNPRVFNPKRRADPAGHPVHRKVPQESFRGTGLGEVRKKAIDNAACKERESPSFLVLCSSHSQGRLTEKGVAGKNGITYGLAVRVTR